MVACGGSRPPAVATVLTRARGRALIAEAEIVKTLRKVLSIIISFALFPKPLNWQYVVGFAVVCASIYLTTKAKKIKREQKALAGGA